MQEPQQPGEKTTPSMRRRVLTTLLATTVMAVATLLAFAPASPAQLPPLVPEPTTTTTQPPPPEDPAQPGAGAGQPSPDGPAPDGPAPDGPAPGDPGGDPGPGEPGPNNRIVPPEAQQIIDAVPRSGPSSSASLVEALGELEALGVPRDEAMAVGMGRFPIAGAATYSHDWLFPRYGPGFRFHLGTDVFAPHGTPLRAPVDGTATSANQNLGGLTVRVTMDDGTFFYLAHLSGLAEGFTEGMAVQTGDIVGFVGDSGNARGGAPHLHIGVYPQGGAPVDPKPILDQWLEEAHARLPEVIEAYRAAGYGAETTPSAESAPPEAIPVPGGIASPAPVALPEVDLASSTLTGVLYAAGANPGGGALTLLGTEVADLAATIDWHARATTSAARVPTPAVSNQLLTGPR